LRELQSLCLNINDGCSQVYDEGANMVGVNSGVKNKILAINPKAFFTVCGCHNWNLLLRRYRQILKNGKELFFLA
jgi:hypothetical protein